MTTTASASRRRQGWLRRHWNALSRRNRRLILGGTVGSFVFFVGLLGVVYARTDIPHPSELDTAQTTIVTYADGSELGRLQGEENRTDIPLRDVPDHVRKAVLAAEDRNYYEHSGISLRGIARAAVQDVLSRNIGQGGSTITQQYARNAFLTKRKTFARKFREAIIAVKLDRTYSKDQVLEWYLNTIYFGRGAYGIEAAARTYFGVPARRLTLEQGAVLAALIRAPEGGDPSVAPDIAKRRWRSVLDGMAKERWIPPGKAETARYPQVRPRGAGGRKAGRQSGPTAYVLEKVRQELLARGFSSAEIYTGGLRVRTTVSRQAQQAAERAVAAVLDDPAKDPQAALVAVEPGTGRIQALYGGRDYASRQFNYATDGRRQTGSAFKPVVLVAALEEGISLRSRYDGRSPQTFAGKEFVNFGPGDGEDFGQIDLVQATAHSVNTVYVPLGLEVGIEDVVKTAHALGTPENTDCAAHRDATLFLGSCEMAPVDVTAMFGTVAAKGRQAPPYLVEEVQDRRGRRVYQAKPKVTEAFEEGVMADATYAMRQVVENGTAPRARLDRPAAGKTGTTSDNTDAWFAGFVPQLAATVWLGYDPPLDENGRPTGPAPRLRNLHGFAEVTGGSLPAMIWQRFMNEALRGVPVQDFPPPVFGGRASGRSPSGEPSPSASTPLPTLSPTVVPSSSPPQPSSSPPESTLPEPTRSPDASEEPSPEPSPSGSAPAGSPEPTP